MTPFRNVAGAAAALIAVAACGAPAAAQMKSRCVLAGGDATMITLDLAKFMAEAALKNSISGMGAKAAGPLEMTCQPPSPLTTCMARQRACK